MGLGNVRQAPKRFRPGCGILALLPPPSSAWALPEALCFLLLLRKAEGRAGEAGPEVEVEWREGRGGDGEDGTHKRCVSECETPSDLCLSPGLPRVLCRRSHLWVTVEGQVLRPCTCRATCERGGDRKGDASRRADALRIAKRFENFSVGPFTVNPVRNRGKGHFQPSAVGLVRWNRLKVPDLSLVGAGGP